MSFLLPPRDSELREALDLEMLANQQWCTLQEARFAARRQFAASPRGLIRSVTFLVLRANDHVQLVSFGPKGGKKVLWDFGTLYGAST